MIGTEENQNTVWALTRLAATRDTEAWGRLLELQGERILRVTRAVLRDEGLAEDAAQETLLRVRDYAKRFRPTGPDPDTAALRWVLRVAYRTALNMRRKRRSDMRRDEAYGREHSREMETHAGHTRPGEGLKDVQCELEKLDDRDRLPIQLRFVAGMDYEKLAGLLDCPVGTVKARVHRGLKKLRSRLAVLGLLIEPLSSEQSASGPIECRGRLGGLLKYYHRDAAA